jgi:hypothetical protein
LKSGVQPEPSVVRTGRSALRLIGYWTGPTAPDWPDPTDFVDPSWDQGERETIADYLRGGFVFRAFGGVSSCRFCGRENGALELSDGVWYWPDGLAHYVADHDVRLPSEFVEHTLVYLDLLGDSDRDVDWWHSQHLWAGDGA